MKKTGREMMAITRTRRGAVRVVSMDPGVMTWSRWFSGIVNSNSRRSGRRSGPVMSTERDIRRLTQRGKSTLIMSRGRSAGRRVRVAAPAQFLVQPEAVPRELDHGNPERREDRPGRELQEPSTETGATEVDDGSEGLESAGAEPDRVDALPERGKQCSGDRSTGAREVEEDDEGHHAE